MGERLCMRTKRASDLAAEVANEKRLAQDALYRQLSDLVREHIADGNQHHARLRRPLLNGTDEQWGRNIANRHIDNGQVGRVFADSRQSLRPRADVLSPVV